MTGPVPAAVDVGLVATVVAAVLVAAGLVAYALLQGEFEASTRPAPGDGEGDDVVCPRCHHRTDPEAGTCPECGKAL